MPPQQFFFSLELVICLYVTNYATFEVQQIPLSKSILVVE